LAEIAAAI